MLSAGGTEMARDAILSRMIRPDPLQKPLVRLVHIEGPAYPGRLARVRWFFRFRMVLGEKAGDGLKAVWLLGFFWLQQFRGKLDPAK